MLNVQNDKLVFCKYTLILNMMPATCFKKVQTGSFLPLCPIKLSGTKNSNC